MRSCRVSLPITTTDLGAEYSRFEGEIFSSGFQDNYERTQTSSVDGGADLDEFKSSGRVTGFFNAFLRTDDGGFVSTGAHLFGQLAGATGFVVRFGEREKRLAGRTVGQTKVDAVTDVPIAGLGEEAAGVAYAFPGISRITLLFRRGRVVGEVTLTRRDASGLQTDAMAIARKLDERIQGVLSGRIAP